MESQLGRYALVARLFNIIDGLPLDKQFDIYKKLVADNLSGELFKLIIDMPEDQKSRLLEQMGAITEDDERLQTVDLDNDQSFMRENPRKICLIGVNCKIGYRSFKSYIIDISNQGVFIESNDRFPVGQKISMTFKLPHYDTAFDLNGRIARSGPRGMGVKFFNLSSIQEEIILKFIESKK